MIEHSKPGLYKVTSRLDVVLEPNSLWLRQVARALFCKRCYRVRPGVTDPINVEVEGEPRGITTYVFRAGSLYSSDFVRVLSPHLVNCIIGKCYVWRGESRVACDQYVHCYVDIGSELEVRQGPGGKYVACSGCGRYTPTHFAEPVHICSSSITDARCYLDGLGALYLHGSLVERIDWSQFDDVELVHIPIVDEVVDADKENL